MRVGEEGRGVATTSTYHLQGSRDGYMSYLSISMSTQSA
jgi:hypothetical protein